MTAVDETAAAPLALDDAADVEELAGALTGRLFEATLGVLELSTVWLGTKLGLYARLTEPRTVGELAEAAGLTRRYAAEWLEQQAIAGLVTVVDATAGADERTYHLSEAQRLVLLEEDSPFYAGAMAMLAGGCGALMPRVLEAYRTGTGIAFGEYGDDVRVGQGMFNKGTFLGPLVQDWLPSTPAVHALLQQDGAVALDLGCGVGWSGIAMAQAYPGLTVHGVDSDEASVMDARRNAAQAGVGERVRYEVAGAQDQPPGSYDVAFFFESLHDMGRPVAALSAVREALRPGGRVLVMDERADEAFAPDGSPLERLLASSSVLHCLPVGMSEPGSMATGALFRPATMRGYAASAGYAAVEELPIEHDMMRFYLLTP